MNNLYQNCKPFVIAINSVVCFIVITDGSVSAQSINPRASGALRRIERMQRQNENYERDKLERQLENGPSRPSIRRNKEDVVQLKQDFEKLQTNHNRIVLAMASNEGVQLEAFLEDVAEIKKAAVRLKSKLALPKPEEVERKAPPKDQPLFDDWLINLQKHLYDFLTNPLFDTPGAYKVEEAKRASGDLMKIIKVSEIIGKRAGVQ